MATHPHIPSPCVNWQFDLVVPGSARADACKAAYGPAYLDAIGSADALASVICNQPFGCKARLVRVNRVDEVVCQQFAPNQFELRLTIHVSYACGA